MNGHAVISDDGRYRYVLTRDWAGGRRAVFIMLNPSTADALQDDPTIRRCIGFAKAWGCGQLAVVNLFAWRATDPRELMRVDDPVGPRNREWIADVCSESAPIVCAWGNHGAYRKQGERVLAELRGMFLTPLHLKLTAQGQPSHPLYLSAQLTPRELMVAVDG